MLSRNIRIILDGLRQDNKKITKNMIWLFLDRIIHMIVNLIIGVWVARYLGPSDFGSINYAIAITALFSAIAGLGLKAVIIRDLAIGNLPIEETLGCSAIIELFSSSISYILLLLISPIFGKGVPGNIAIIRIVGLTLLLKGFEFSTFWFEAKIQSQYTVIVQNISFILFSFIKIIMILYSCSVTLFAWTIFLEAFFSAILLVTIINCKVIKINKLTFNFNRSRIIIKDSFPLLLSSIASVIAMRVDQIMIGAFLTNDQVGNYSAAVRIAEFPVFIAMAISQSTFPHMINIVEEKFKNYFIKLLRYPFYIILLFSIFISLFSKLIINIFYGSEYGVSTNALSILAFSAPLTYVSILSSNYLIRNNKHKEIFFRQLIGLFTNIILNTIMIPILKNSGAALATVITDLVISFGIDIFRKEYRDFLQIKFQSIILFKKIEIS